MLFSSPDAAVLFVIAGDPCEAGVACILPLRLDRDDVALLDHGLAQSLMETLTRKKARLAPNAYGQARGALAGRGIPSGGIALRRRGLEMRSVGRIVNMDAIRTMHSGKPGPVKLGGSPWLNSKKRL
jgi:hypothetical protein